MIAAVRAVSVLPRGPLSRAIRRSNLRGMEVNSTRGQSLRAPGDCCVARSTPPARGSDRGIRRHDERKNMSKENTGFRTGDFVVYPTHGVGKIIGIEAQEISGISLQVIIINFDKDRMTLRVPVSKAKNSGLRRLSTRKVMDAALTTLKGRSRVKRAMWSRRAQVYEAKINSGDPVSIAEV